MLLRPLPAVLAILLLPYCSNGGGEAPVSAPSRAAPPAASGSPAPQPATIATGEPRELAGITRAHNAARKHVGVPPLEWDDRLAATARAWARRCVDREAPRGMLDHNPDRGEGHPEYVGENIMASTAPVSGRQAVDSWVVEAEDYDHARNRCARGRVCGHYTQVVWEATERVGCATHTCPRLDFPYVVVCDYGPGGNLRGRPPY